MAGRKRAVHLYDDNTSYIPSIGDPILSLGMEKQALKDLLDQVGATTLEKAYNYLKSQDRLLPGMTMESFREIYDKL